MIKYSIIIGALNHLEDGTKPCIESIIANTDLSNVEIIVVANGCTDGTEDYIRSLWGPFFTGGPREELINTFRLLSYPKPLGYAKANNEGIKVAKGEYIILLNNDCVLLPQPTNQWLEMLEAPFINNPKIGVTGPGLLMNTTLNVPFIVFYCAMIKRELIQKLQLNEEYEIGGAEDTEFCIEAKKLGYEIQQVPNSNVREDKNNEKLIIGGFPIYHSAEKTVGEFKNWKAVFKMNDLKLIKKYDPEKYKQLLHNNYERAVIDDKEPLIGYLRESARYNYASTLIKPGDKVLEIGCSSGYGLRFFPKDIYYTGLDYDEAIIDYARENFADNNRQFICADINTFEFKEHYDVIVAYEIIEHLSNGKELAQELKNHCDKLIISTPYREIPGYWGQHHKLHKLTQYDFPKFDHQFINEQGYISGTPSAFDGSNLMVMRWERNHAYKEPKPRVLAFIPTKNRYNSLMLTLQSIIQQTVIPDKILIFDDGEHKDLREDPTYLYLFKIMDKLGIEWEVIFGGGKGQHFGHEIANCSSFDFVLRVDDDEILQPNVLEVLLMHVTPEVGAVGGSVITPGAEVAGGTSELIHIFDQPNIQWSTQNTKREVEHLYSSFLYRTGVAHYNLNLSPVAHREETLFSLQLREKGYKLLFVPEAITYHLRQETGGIRDQNCSPEFLESMFVHDDLIFTQYLETLGIKVITLDSGLGDHLVFINFMNDLLNKYRHLLIGCCYPEVFDGYKDLPNVHITSITNMPKVTDIYKFMIDNKWNSSILLAYKKMLGL